MPSAPRRRSYRAPYVDGCTQRLRHHLVVSRRADGGPFQSRRALPRTGNHLAASSARAAIPRTFPELHAPGSVRCNARTGGDDQRMRTRGKRRRRPISGPCSPRSSRRSDDGADRIGRLALRHGRLYPLSRAQGSRGRACPEPGRRAMAAPSRELRRNHRHGHHGVPRAGLTDTPRRFAMNRRGGPMKLSDHQVRAVAAYVRSISREKR